MPLALFAALALAGVRTNIRVNPNLPTHATADFDDQPFRVAHYRHGIVFDAGSSGSRIHVYTYKEGGRPPRTQFDLVKDDLVKISPGLSSFKDDPAAAGSSLQPLIDHAKKVVPASRHYRVPVFLMATAGLRMVGEKAKDEILDSVRATLARSGFVFRDEWVTVLDGRDEGIYGWATVNYLKHTLYPKQGEASGVIDLGGGSVQIVFPMKRKRVAPLGYQRQLNYAGREHNLYVKSHLGYGLDAARDTLYERLIEAAAISATPGETPDEAAPISHPCLPKKSRHTINGRVFVGEGSYVGCVTLTEGLFDKTSCLYGSCSFNGAYQPKLPDTFYGFSYLYDRTAAIGLLDGHIHEFGETQVTIDGIEHAAEGLCHHGEPQLAERFREHPDLHKVHNFCGDVVYLAVLLRALGFDDQFRMTMTNKIDDVELVWTLGAMLSKIAELATEKTIWDQLMEPQNIALELILVLAIYWFFCCARATNKHSYRHVMRSETTHDQD